MKKTLVWMFLGTFLLLIAGPVKAEIFGFQINGIEGLGALEGLVEERLSDEYKVSYQDCLLYLEGVIPTTVVEGEPLAEYVEETPDVVEAPYCGDGTCDDGEDCVTCLADACPECGDGECQVNEHCGICPSDCGECRETDVITESDAHDYPGDILEEVSGDNGKEDNIKDSSASRKLEVKWSLTAPTLSSYYIIRIGSCSETLDISEGETDSCRTLVSKDDLDSYSNNELIIEITDLLGEECVFGDTGETAVYFYVQDIDEFYAPEVEVVKFTWDYDPPEKPTDVVIEPGEENIKVSWTDEANSGFVEYKVYWDGVSFTDDSKSDAESKEGLSATSYQVEGLEVGKVYYVAVAAMDDYDNESDLSEVLSDAPISVDDFWEHYRKSGGGEEGGFCFVATAAWGTTMEPSVQLLQRFRDAFLLTTPWGRRLVDFYYIHGPVAAAFIKGSPAWRFAARVALAPAVAVAWFALDSSRLVRTTLLLLALAALFYSRRRYLATGRTGRVS